MRCLVLTATGSRHLAWYYDDEVAFFLLRACFHPYYHVLGGASHQREVTFLMDALMRDLPPVHLVIRLRADFWEGMTSIPRMFGGAGSQADVESAAFAELLKQITPYFTGTKKDKLKCLLRGTPGLRQKVQKVAGNADKVRSLMGDAAVRVGMSLTAPSSSRSKSLEPQRSAPHGASQRSSSQTPRSCMKKVEIQTGQDTSAPSSTSSKPKKETSKSEEPQVELNLVNEWNVPPLATFSPTSAGIYMAESKDTIASWAAQVRNASFASGVVTPYAHEIAGLSKPTQVLANMIEKRNGVERKITARAWLINLTSTPVVLTSPHAAMCFDAPAKRTLVTSIDVIYAQAPKEWQEALQKHKASELRQLLQTLIQKAEAIHDAWQVTEPKPGLFRFKIRLAEEHLVPVLRLSGQHGIFVNSPQSANTRFSLIWLKEAQQKLDLAAALEKLAKVSAHRGLIRRDEGVFAIRCETAQLSEARKALDLDIAEGWKLDGLPLDFHVQDVENVIKQLPWTGTVVPTSKYCRKGKASWTIRTDVEPPTYRFPIVVGERTYHVSVSSNRSEGLAVPELQPQVVRGARTWADLFKGKLLHEPPQPACARDSGSSWSQEGSACRGCGRIWPQWSYRCKRSLLHCNLLYLLPAPKPRPRSDAADLRLRMMKCLNGMALTTNGWRNLPPSGQNSMRCAIARPS